MTDNELDQLMQRVLLDAIKKDCETENSGKNLQFTIHAYLPQSRILQMAESVSELP